MRKKVYYFPKDFFKYKLVSTFLKFKVGDLEVKNMTLIENHYFKNQRIATYEFNFPYCVPNSVNTWEYVYEIPELPQEYKNQLLLGETTTSDTFFFVEDDMIMHNKSEYEFTE